MNVSGYIINEYIKGRRKIWSVIAIWAVLFFIGIDDAVCGQSTKPKAHRFGYKQVVDKAAELADAPFQEPEKIPDNIANITYDQWRKIKFNPKKAVWFNEGLLYRIQFMHPGNIYTIPVKINVIGSAQVKPVLFSPRNFIYDNKEIKDRIPKNLGFAGFRVHYRFNASGRYNECLVFLGASYFRAAGRNQYYGLSARGIAVNTALKSGEEFPFFKEFWLLKPMRGEKTMTLYALLDSQSMSGGYEFRIKPGVVTQMRVKGTIFRRRSVEKMGLMPLTSMYFYGKDVNIRPRDIFQPEIHDSDGLLIATGARGFIWRPLNNPARLMTSKFPVTRLTGFGLMQRDRDYDHYQDLEAFYHMRPSAWITPEGKWGAGYIELIEIPSDADIHDNITAFWVPDHVPDVKKPIMFAYRINWGDVNVDHHGKAEIVATRTAILKDKPLQKFVLEFKGGKVAWIKNAKPVNADIAIGKGAHLVNQKFMWNSFNRTLLFSFMVEREDDNTMNKVGVENQEPIPIRVYLERGNKVISETWNYQIK